VSSLVAGIAASLAAAAVAPPAPEKAPRFAFPVDGRARIGMEEAQRFGGARDHGGQDVFARCGTPVIAAHAGRVRRATFEGAAGNYVVVDGDGGRSFVYMHLRRPARAREGRAVRTGQRLGAVGRTGDADGCHLHFEIWTAPGWYRGGRPVDPYRTLSRAR
jgi:murein DD-endopeptidase MepM/ murein hydrolase activator NlpD